MAGACRTELRSPPSFVRLFWTKNVFGTPKSTEKGWVAVDAGLRNRATLGGKRLVFALQAQDQEWR